MRKIKMLIYINNLDELFLLRYIIKSNLEKQEELIKNKKYIKNKYYSDLKKAFEKFDAEFQYYNNI